MTRNPHARANRTGAALPATLALAAALAAVSALLPAAPIPSTAAAAYTAHARTIAAITVVQKRSARTKHLRAELSRGRATNDLVVRLLIEPRNGWRIIAVDDTLSGRPLRVTWKGATQLTRMHAGTPYAVAQDTARVYDRPVEMTARLIRYPVIARIEYVACREVCEAGAVSVVMTGAF